MPWRARPQKAADGSLSGDDQILEVLADRLAVSQVVVMRDERIDQRFVLGAPRLPQRHTAELAKAALDRRRVDCDRRRRASHPGANADRALGCRQLDVAAAMERKQQ